MIIGDPYKFAILSGIIKEWNMDDTFCNGFLLFCVNGDIYPKEVVTATLRCEIEYLKQKLRNLTTDKWLYTLPPQQAFAEIYGITFPEDMDNDNEVSETFVSVSEMKEIISDLENFPFI